jgi:hypothetical protein
MLKYNNMIKFSISTSAMMILGINLLAGARFGGYGSFLPTYQQSPSIWSHSGTPQKGQNNHSHDLPLEVCGWFFVLFCSFYILGT